VQTPRQTEGPEIHLRAVRYHTRACKNEEGHPLFLELHQKAQARYLSLKAAIAAVTAVEEELSDLSVDIHFAEIRVRRQARTFQLSLQQLDRESAGLGALARAFPEGMTEFAQARGEELPALFDSLRSRLDPLKDHPVVSAGLSGLSEWVAALGQVLSARAAAKAQRRQRYDEQRVASRAVREQLKGAYGRLLDLFRAEPARAEAYFLRFRAGRAVPEEEAETTAPSAASTPVAEP
jgi:hypothetical protein